MIEPPALLSIRRYTSDLQVTSDLGRKLYDGRMNDQRRILDPLARAVARVGDRWSLLVVDALGAGPQRFNDLQGAIEGIATNVLAKRLEQLEREDILIARPYSQRPPRYAYELTGAGHDLAGVLAMLREWGAVREGAPAGSAEGSWQESSGAPAHEACGTPMQRRWWCPWCEELVVSGGDTAHANDAGPAAPSPAASPSDAADEGGGALRYM